MKKPIIVWTFIFVLMVTIPEAGMRIRYGLPPCEPDPCQFKYTYVDIYKKFFKKVHEKGRDVYIPQRTMNLARGFVAVKDANTVRIFLIGGSVAYDWYQWDLYKLENIFKDLIPDKDFEIINCGMCGYDSYRVYLVEKEILSYQPDLIIILSGNNEFYDKVKVNLRAYYTNKFLRKLWIYRKLQDHFLQWCDELEIEYSRDREQRLVNYGKNIRRIVRKAKAKRVPIILCTLPVNFRDCAPAEKYPLDKQFLLGKFLLENENYLVAEDTFKKFLKDKPNDSFGYYFLGRAYDKMENYQKAKENYLMALELSYGSGRASPSSNAIIRRICAEGDAGLADLEKAFMDIASHGLLGREQFYDSCHWWDEYYFLVAKVVVREIVQKVAVYLLILDPNKYKLDSFPPPCNFISLSERGKRENDIKHINISVWEALEYPHELSECAISYFGTLYLMDQDSLWKIQFSKEEIKETFMNDPWLKEIIPAYIFEKQWPSVLYHVGETYRRLKLYKEALTYFNKAIALDENNYLPYIGRALVYHTFGDKGKAQDNINRADEFSESVEIKYYKEILGL